MNIVFLLRLWPIYGGGETVTICLANEMAKRGHAVTVFYFKDSETNELPYIDPSIKAVRIPDVRCDEYTYDSDDGIKITIALKLYQQNSFDFIINQWWPVVFLSPLRSFFGIKEQIDTITNRYNKWLYLFLNILFATCYHNNVYISFHFHMGMDHFFRVSYLLQRLLPLSYLVQNQLFE